MPFAEFHSSSMEIAVWNISTLRPLTNSTIIFFIRFMDPGPAKNGMLVQRFRNRNAASTVFTSFSHAQNVSWFHLLGNDPQGLSAGQLLRVVNIDSLLSNDAFDSRLVQVKLLHESLRSLDLPFFVLFKLIHNSFMDRLELGQRLEDKAVQVTRDNHAECLLPIIK